MAETTQLEREIAEQPDALRHVLQSSRNAVAEAADLAVRANPRWVLVAARGTSDNAARYAKYLFGAHNRMGVGLALPSLYTLYDSPPDASQALTIGISQSGQSPDVVSVLQCAGEQGGSRIAITNDPGSPLARAADVCIPLDVGEERAVAATKTYTAELMVLAMLSTAWSGEQAHADALEHVPDAVAARLAQCPDLTDLATPFRHAERFVVLGRGYNYCTAFELALKMKETSYVLAEPYSPADFLHGPIALLEEGFPAILMAPTGAGGTDADRLLDKLQQRGARALVFSDRPDLRDRTPLSLPLSPGVPEWLSPMVGIVAAQRWAVALSAAKGFDADHPRGLSKVTRTR